MVQKANNNSLSPMPSGWNKTSDVKNNKNDQPNNHTQVTRDSKYLENEADALFNKLASDNPDIWKDIGFSTPPHHGSTSTMSEPDQSPEMVEEQKSEVNRTSSQSQSGNLDSGSVSSGFSFKSLLSNIGKAIVSFERMMAANLGYRKISLSQEELATFRFEKGDEVVKLLVKDRLDKESAHAVMLKFSDAPLRDDEFRRSITNSPVADRYVSETNKKIKNYNIKTDDMKKNFKFNERSLETIKIGASVSQFVQDKLVKLNEEMRRFH